MRKLGVILMSVLMTLTFAACGGSEAGNTAPKSSGEKSAVKDNKPQPSNKTLVAYFSASGNTKKLAETTAKAIGADIYEIVPEKPYTKEDLNYNNENSRSSVENRDSKARPALKDKNANIASYDKIVLAYPIWWGKAPRILETFVESYDFSGKTVVAICTSGGSDIGSSADYLKSVAQGSFDLKGGKLFSPNVSTDEIKSWWKSLGLDK